MPSKDCGSLWIPGDCVQLGADCRVGCQGDIYFRAHNALASRLMHSALGGRHLEGGAHNQLRRYPLYAVAKVYANLPIAEVGDLEASAFSDKFSTYNSGVLAYFSSSSFTIAVTSLTVRH